MNVNLPRWMFSSMVEHFRTVTPAGVAYFVEGVDEEEAANFQVDSMLFRMDGPFAYQSSGGEEWYKVEARYKNTMLAPKTETLTVR